MNITDFAQVYSDMGFNCIPLIHHTKDPALNTWKEFQTEKYTGGFKEGQNLGILTGEISNLIVIDIDDMSLVDEITEKWSISTDCKAARR